MQTVRKVYALIDRSQRRPAAVLLIFTLAGLVLEMLGLGMIIPVVALLTQDDLGGTYPVLRPWLQALGNPTSTQLVVGGMLGLVAIHLLRVSYLGVLAWRQMRFAFRQQALLSQRLFTVYLRQPYAFHLNRNSAQLIQCAMDEARLFTFSVMLPAMLILSELSAALGLAALLVLIEPIGAVGVFVALALAAWVFQRAIRALIDRNASARQHHEGMRLQHLQQGLAGAKDARVLGREDYFLSQYWFHNDRSARVGTVIHTLFQLPRLWLELLVVCGLAALVLTMLARGGSVAGIVPTLGLFVAAAFRMMPSVNRIMSAVQSLRFALPVIDRLHAEILLEMPEPEPRGRREGSPFEREIAFEDVRFSYPQAHVPAAAGISLSIRRGEAVGFVGSSGSGKSTLVDLLLGLLTPDAGRITVDGKDIRDHVRGWQDQVGYVPQTIYLTDDTLRRNVAFGVPDEQIDPAAVQRAIAAAQLDDFVAGLPDGLATMVGERGVRLSGGQRQRIGIARALYHDPAVLVLDEATSALDTETERGVMRAVNALHGRKTLVIVAHRLTTLAGCDRLYTLEGGRVAAETATPARTSR